MKTENLKQALSLFAQGFAALADAVEATDLAQGNAVKETKAPKETKAKETKVKEEVKKDEPKKDEVKKEETKDDFNFEDDFGGGSETPVKTFTLDEIRAACIAHAQVHTKEKTYEILKKYKGATKPAELEASSYPDVMKDLYVDPSLLKKA